MPGGWRPRQRWGAGVLVATGALLALIAVVADGSPLEGPPSDDTIRIDERVLLAALVLAAVAAVVVLVLMVWSLAGGKAPRHRNVRRRPWWSSLVSAATIVLLVFAFARIKPATRGEQRPAEGGDSAVPEAGGRRPDPPVWPVVVLGVTFLLAMVGATVGGRRGRPRAVDGQAPTTGATDGQRIEAARAFDASIDELLAEPEPRTAVIAAYASLLAGLERAGFGRRAAEAPREHLARTLADLDVPAVPMRTLVALFEEARFSPHPIVAAHKDAAISAFRQARAALPGPVPA